MYFRSQQRVHEIVKGALQTWYFTSMKSFKNIIWEDCCIEICLFATLLPSQCGWEYAMCLEVTSKFTSNDLLKKLANNVFALWWSCRRWCWNDIWLILVAAEDNCVAIPMWSGHSGCLRWAYLLGPLCRHPISGLHLRIVCMPPYVARSLLKSCANGIDGFSVFILHDVLTQLGDFTVYNIDIKGKKD